MGRAGKLRAEGGSGLAGLTGARSLVKERGAAFRRPPIGDGTVRAPNVYILAERAAPEALVFFPSFRKRPQPLQGPHVEGAADNGWRTPHALLQFVARDNVEGVARP